MPAKICPAACPGCQRYFQLSYSRRSKATMAPGARLALTAGIALTVVLFPVLLVLVGYLVLDLTDGMGLRRRERGMLFFLAQLLSVPVALVPAWLGWRFAFARPR